MLSAISLNIIIFISLSCLITSFIIILYYRGSAEKSDLKTFQPLPIMGDTDRILIFCPHPDDETIAAGGLIFSARENGALVRVILATDGNQLGLGKLRYKEFVYSLNKLQVPASQLVSFNYPDTKLSKYQADLSEKINQEIDSYKPNIIVCPDPFDLHSDHRFLAKAVLNLVNSQCIYTYLVHYPWWPNMLMLVKEHFLLPPRKLACTREWAYLSLTPSARQAKHNALSYYRSQLLNPFIRPKIMRLLQNNELFAVYKTGDMSSEVG